MRKADFSNLLKVLDRKRPERPTLFEFFLNPDIYARLTGIQARPEYGAAEWLPIIVKGFAAAGYDYGTVLGSEFGFPRREAADRLKSISQNQSPTIIDRASFNAYQWKEPDHCNYSRLDDASRHLAEGMKLIVHGPGGVLENAIALVGYENLCLMIIDDPQLAGDVFDAVGSRLLRYYEIACRNKNVGAAISNDDWGHNQQTMLSPEDMRRYVIPWHRKIVKAIHAAGMPAILHSCGNLAQVMDDIIDDIGYDGKHSYEDKIMPVEQAYERYGRRIAILGGIDVDFVCRSTPDAIRARCRAMLKQTDTRGGYALGTGNSVPTYVPQENYFAMIETATGMSY